MPATTEQACVEEIPIPGGPPPGTDVRKGIASDALGRIWFTLLELNQIDVFDPITQQLAIFSIPTTPTGPHSIVVDSKGIVWFTGIFSNAIGRFDPASETFGEEFPPTPSSGVYGMAVDGQDNVWFTEMDAVQIGVRLAATGNIVEFPMDPALDAPRNLAVDPATGDIWITEGGNEPAVNGQTFTVAGKLARLVPGTGAFTRFTIPHPLSAPHSLAVDVHGDIWFTDPGANLVGRLTPSVGEFRLFALSTPGATPHGIVVDRRATVVWFTELSANKIGVIVPERRLFSELDLPAPAGPYFITQASDGEIWFTEGFAMNLGRLPCTVR